MAPPGTSRRFLQPGCRTAAPDPLALAGGAFTPDFLPLRHSADSAPGNRPGPGTALA